MSHEAFFWTPEQEPSALTHSLTLSLARFLDILSHLRPRPDINTSQLAAPAPPGEERLSLFTSRPVVGL